MRKDYLAFFISLFLSRLADQILLFIVPLIVFQATNSASWAGLAFFVESLPRFLAPGDVSTLRLDLAATDAPSGDYNLAVSGNAAIATDMQKTLALATGGCCACDASRRSRSSAGSSAR